MGQKRHHKRLLRWLRLTPTALAVAAAGVATAGLYLWHLGRFIGQGPAEAQTAASYASLGNILANPVNLPYKLLDYISLSLPFGSLAMRGRLASVILALACGLVFYWLAQRWHGARNAALATILFVPSGWMLATGRHGSGLIMLSLLTLGLVALASWVQNTPVGGKALVWYAAAAAVALTIPGGLWFLAAVTLVILPRLREDLSGATPVQRAVSAGLLALSTLIIVAAIIKDFSLLWQWLGVPPAIPGIVTIATQAAGSLGFLLARGPFMPEVWLAHTPVLDAASSAMFILGAIFYVRHRNNARVRLLLIFGSICVVIIALQGAAALAYIVPLVYLVAATGIAYILHSWQKVFPKNPFAYWLSVGLLTVLTVSVLGYHTQRYFVAWRNSPDTRAEYAAPDGNLKASNLIQ